MYLLEPEVAGGFGENTDIVHENGRVKEVRHLHYEFYGWLGDELLTTTPCFIVTEYLAKTLIDSDCNGFRYEDVEISTSEEFQDL